MTAPILHGWTLDGLSEIATRVVLSNRGWYAGDVADLHSAALSGIALHLAEAAGPPSRSDLMRAGRKALLDDAVASKRHHGRWHNEEPFSCYWDWLRSVSSPEDRVVDRTALAQIWWQLRPRHREAITALAAAGDYRDAAAVLGIGYSSFSGLMSHARREFLALWHEGETPSRQWRMDRRRPGRRPETPEEQEQALRQVALMNAAREGNAAGAGTGRG